MWDEPVHSGRNSNSAEACLCMKNPTCESHTLTHGIKQQSWVRTYVKKIIADPFTPQTGNAWVD